MGQFDCGETMRPVHHVERNAIAQIAAIVRNTFPLVSFTEEMTFSEDQPMPRCFLLRPKCNSGNCNQTFDIAMLVENVAMTTISPRYAGPTCPSYVEPQSVSALAGVAWIQSGRFGKLLGGGRGLVELGQRRTH